MVTQQIAEITQPAVTEEEKLLQEEAGRLKTAMGLLIADNPVLPETEQGAATLLQRASKDLYGQESQNAAALPVVIQHLKGDVNQARINIQKAIAQLNACRAGCQKIIEFARNVRTSSKKITEAERMAAQEVAAYGRELERRIEQLNGIIKNIDKIFALQVNQMPMMRNIAEDNSRNVRVEASFINDFRNHMIKIFNFLKKIAEPRKKLLGIF